MGEDERRRIGARFKAERRSLGLTQREAAARAGLTQKKVSLLEAGGLDAQFDTFARLAKALGKRLRSFMDD